LSDLELDAICRFAANRTGFRADRICQAWRGLCGRDAIPRRHAGGSPRPLARSGM